MNRRVMLMQELTLDERKDVACMHVPFCLKSVSACLPARQLYFQDVLHDCIYSCVFKICCMQCMYG
jgi:hypothetical protein